MASYGRRDRGLPGRAGKPETALSTLGVEHDVKEYADSGHSFMDCFNVGPTMSPVLKFTGMNYVHDDAEDSWRRILDFFGAHLRG